MQETRRFDWIEMSLGSEIAWSHWSCLASLAPFRQSFAAIGSFPIVKKGPIGVEVNPQHAVIFASPEYSENRTIFT